MSAWVGVRGVTVIVGLWGSGMAACDPAGAAPRPEEEGFAPRRSVVIDHAVKTLEGEPMKLSQLRGRTLLIVNTASACGYTPQYEGLQALHDRYEERGLVVLGFPSNDFGGQEPGDAKTIREYVSKTFGVRFPMFEKQKVKGPDKSPLYKTLTEELGAELGGEVRWNFEKFLVDAEGRVVARFRSSVDPLSPEVLAAIEATLPRR